MSLQFLTYIKEGETKLPQAILYLRTYLTPHMDLELPFRDKEGKMVLLAPKEIVGLVCYGEPRQSELGYLLDDQQNDAVADYVNSKLLGNIYIYIFRI